MIGADRQLDLLLRLQLTPGVGPIIGRRLLGLFADPAHIFSASPADLQRVEGIGPAKARTITAGLREAESCAQAEHERADRAGVELVCLGAPCYPPLLAEVPDAPLVLYVRGKLSAENTTHTVGIVGSRRATAYGIEQAERFATMLAQSGLTVVSGGARGIDSAAHRAAVRSHAPTIVVLGCGIGQCYPPENAELFESVVEQGGAVISELPFDTTPAPENFPARNRIISGLSLGIILIEAPRGSGALITARHATEEHGREVMAIPGRIDSSASEGSNQLIKKCEAALVTCPADVIDLLESQARHVHDGTHAVRYAQDQLPAEPTPQHKPTASTIAAVTESQRRILEALADPLHLDELQDQTGMAPESIRADVTILEVRGLVERHGSALRRRKTPS